MEDDTSDEDEQDQARFVLYYNSDSSSVCSRPSLVSLLCYCMVDLFIRNPSASLGYKGPRVYRMVMALRPKDSNINCYPCILNSTLIIIFFLTFIYLGTYSSQFEIYMSLTKESRFLNYLYYKEYI